MDVAVDGQRRLALSDKGLVMLARRDRTSVGDARKRWSASPLDDDAPLEWRNVAGTRTRQLLRNMEHTSAVHGFISALARQARSRSREIVQLDPPRRASRYFRHDGKLRSVHPDAFGVLRWGNDTWPFFLEWERRAVRPAPMAARVGPYLRYYASPRPTDDHGAQPLVLVVFDDGIALTPLPGSRRPGDGTCPRAGAAAGVSPGAGGGCRSAGQGLDRPQRRTAGLCPTPLNPHANLGGNNENLLRDGSPGPPLATSFPPWGWTPGPGTGSTAGSATGGGSWYSASASPLMVGCAPVNS